MNQAQRSLRRALVLSCIVIGFASLAFGQASDPKSSASAIIDQIMTAALSRCYSTVEGIKGNGHKWYSQRITFEPATNQEFAEVKELGEKAVAPLAKYLDLQKKTASRSFMPLSFSWRSAALPR